MSTISGVGGAGSAWSGLGASRAAAMKEKMFAKVDSDASGTVDKTELQAMLDHIAEKDGSSLGSVDDLLATMDSDGSGSLNQDELDAGMKSLMPPPASTLDFAQQRAADTDAADLLAQLDTDGDSSISESELAAALAGGPDGPPPPPDGMPPPLPGASSSGSTDSTASTSSTSGSTSTDPLDTNGDGVVSAQERAVGELGDMLQNLLSALDGSAPDSSDAQASSDRRQGGLNLAALTGLLMKEYGAAANYAQSSALSVAA